MPRSGLSRRQFVWTGLGAAGLWLPRWALAQPASPSGLQVGGNAVSWSLVGSSGSFGAGSSTTITSNVASVAAGDTVIVEAINDNSQDTMSVSDGTSSLTGLTLNSVSVLRHKTFYLLSSVATGTVTYTVTYGAPTATTNRGILVYVFRASGGTVSFDQDNRGNEFFGTTIATGNITTTGTDELVVVGHFNSSAVVPTSQQINGVAADGTHAEGSDLLHQWYRIVSSTFTGQGTGTMGSSGRHTDHITSFKITGGGAAAGHGPHFAFQRNRHVYPVGRF